MALKGASLTELVDFCNNNGIPARRNKYWQTSSWNALLKQSVILQFAGYGIWDVHTKKGRIRPASEWVIVPKAHEALISEEEARTLLEVRQARKCNGPGRRFDSGLGRSRKTQYSLTGGLFKCDRCDSNMIGLKRANGNYYVCGSQPYRKGKGCGPGVYVRQDQVENEVLSGARDLLSACMDSSGFVDEFNKEVRRIWEEGTGMDPDAERKLEAVKQKVENVHRAIEDGISDTTWANLRITELKGEQTKLETLLQSESKPPDIDVSEIRSYRERVDKHLVHGTNRERKLIMRTLVDDIRLAPEELVVDVTYRLPEPMVNNMVAGTYDDVIHEFFADRLVRKIPIRRRGRRKRSSTSSTIVA